ncbi:hypothetical protein HY375_00780 [Candidatus Berkelbacteria bacterium]|nr:hypothetical protein [Candidatus Berkelbacteria bacterium]
MVGGKESGTVSTHHAARWWIIGVIVVVLGVAGWWYLAISTPEASELPAETPESVDDADATATISIPTKTTPSLIRHGQDVGASNGVLTLEDVVLTDENLNNLEVITLPDGQYRMFFHQFNAIKSALSSDGQHFTLEPGTRLTGQMPATIKLADGRYRMYFNADGNLKSAISSDGFTFTVEEGIRLAKGGQYDRQAILHPSIVTLPDGTYRLYYDGEAPSGQDDLGWRILSAHSSDGLTWTKDEGLRFPATAGEGEGNGDEDATDFDMIFSAHAEQAGNETILSVTAQTYPLGESGIWQATSQDGLNFTLADQPLLARDAQYGDGNVGAQGGPPGMPQDPFVLTLADQTQRLFYWINDAGTFSASLE